MTLRSTALACLLALAAGPAAALDPRDLDPKTAACTDFYQYANGGWLQRTPVPPGRDSYGSFDALIEQNLTQQRALLDGILAQPQGPLDALIADFVAAGLDETAIEAGGLGALAPLLAEVDAMKRARDLPALIARWHARGIPVLLRFDVGDDLRDPKRLIAYATQGGLVLPDRDFYLREDPATRELLGRYRGYAQTLLRLAGSVDPERDSGRALGIEMRLAAASLSLLQLRDPNNGYRITEVREIQRRYPAFDWSGFLKAQDQRRLKSLSFPHGAFFDEVERLLTGLPLDDWRPYLKLQLLDAFAPYLGAAFVAAHDELHGRLLRGELRPPQRLDRVLAAADLALGDAIGQRYVERYLSPAAQAQAREIVEDVVATLRGRIEVAPWLGEAARGAALAKLETLEVKLGQPERWRDYRGLSLDRRSYVGNVLAAAAFRNRQRMAAIGESRPAGYFPVPVQSVNGYYAPNRNQLALSAGLLQSPLFDPEADPALNYGALGAFVGHELMHGFDAAGQLFDARGALEGGWDAEQRAAYFARVEPLQAQYDAYSAVGAIKVDGRRTLTENIADLAGVELAWAAFAARAGDVRLPQRQGHSPAQRFFLAWAALWRRNDLEPALIQRLAVDVQAPPRQRVNGPLANLGAFAEAFACKAGDPLAPPADRQVRIWAP